MMLRKPTCSDCPHNLQYMESLPIKKKGVTMHLGERFCVAGKRARKFKRSDPKTYVPSWCPRLKAPCELRIYGFKNQREWRMHRSMCAYLGEDISPSAFRYAVRYEGHTDLAPYEFFECCNEKSVNEILGAQSSTTMLWKSTTVSSLPFSTKRSMAMSFYSRLMPRLPRRISGRKLIEGNCKKLQQLPIFL